MPVRDRATPPTVLPTNEARKCLSKAAQLFKERGADAEPVFFGPHREPAGVMLSYERYLHLLDLLDDLTIALEVRKRDRADQGERLTLEELIREQGFEPADFDL
jgi:antitoxin StbD